MTPQQTSAPDTLPADFFSASTATAPDTLPKDFFSGQAKAAPATLPADFFSRQAAPDTLPAHFFSQPAHDPNTRFFSGTGQAEIRAFQPTIWQRVKQAVTAGIPNYSSRTIYNPRYGEAQLLSPEEAMTPSEQRAHPIATGIGEVAGGLTTPQSVALLAGTAGLGELPGAAAMLPRLMSAGFGAQAIYGAAKTYPEIRDAIERGDVAETERLLAHAVGNLAMAALATQHAATGEGAVSGKARTEVETPARVTSSNTPEGAKAHNEAFARAKKELGPDADVHAVLARAQTVLHEPTSPVGEILHEQAPNVRVADSAAAARDVIEKDTKIRPAQEGGDRRLDIDRRARVAEMSPEEMKRELLTSKVTGLPNRRAFDEADSPAVAMSDADGLKALNDKYGYAAGDALLKAKAEALRKAGVDAYHDKGDEFVYRGQSPAELTEKLETARGLLRNRTIDVKNPDGTVTSFKGADFSYGAGQDITEAESGLKEHKTTREARGERARGELRGIAEVGPGEGGSDQGATERLGQGATPEARTEARVTGPSGISEFRNSARVVSDDFVPVVSREEILAHAVSNVLSNSDELQNAGVDLASIKTNRDVDSVLQRASDVIKSNLDPRAYDTLTFETQKGLAADLGMSVEDLLSRRGGQAFNTEEALAARALLAQSARHTITLAKMAAASGDPASLNEATVALSQHQSIQEHVAGITAEAGRALGGFRIDKASLPEVKIANVLSKLAPEARAEAVRLLSKFDPSDPATLRQVNKFAEQVKPSSTMQKLFEYYRNSLLSSPHTIIVKTASEASMIAMETMKKAVAGGIAKFKSSPDRFAAESWYYAKGMAQALSEHAKPILSGEFQLEGSPGFEKAGQQAIKGKLGSVIRTPSEAMSRATNLIYAANYFGEINALAARQAISEGLSGESFNARQEHLSHHPTEDMQESAHKLAMTNTFQSQLGPFAEKIGQAISTKPNAAWLPESAKSVAPLKWLFPFYKTPINLVKASLTHATPFELLSGIAKGDTDALARGVLGSSISAAIAYLALNGTISGGGPTDFKKEETKRATGWMPYSVKIGNKYFSYKRFEPLGLAMGLIADAVHGMKSGDSEVVAQSKTDSAVKHVMRNLDDLPFLGTLANLLQAVHDPVGGRAQSFINREAGSLIPAGVANVAETFDPTIRRPQSALQAIESRIPGLTSAAPPIVDITGHTVQRPASNLGGANPFPFTTAKHDPVVDELARLGISTPQPPTQIKWRGKLTQLTDSERQRFAQEEGEQLYKRVGRVMQSGAWQRRTDDQKRKALVELHHMIDESRPARLTKIRRESHE